MYLKRLFRNLKRTPLKNICYVLLIALSVMLIVSLNRSSASFLDTLTDFYQDSRVESGEFTILGSLSKRQLLHLSSKYQVEIEEQYFLDEKLKKEVNPNEPTLRIYSSEQRINALAITQGTPPLSPNEIVLDPKFADIQGYKIGDQLSLGGYDLTVVGYGITPNYTYTLKNLTDFINSPLTFGVGYVSQIGYDRLKPVSTSTTTYSFIKLDNGDCTDLKLYLEDHLPLLNFLMKKDNTRMEAVYNDAKAPMEIGLIVGTLLTIIVAFMISISIKNTISAESQTIGILYAQGFSKGEVLISYISMPLLLTIIGIILGYLCGVPLSQPLLIIQNQQYTIPPVILKDSVYLIVVGIIVPFVLTLLISYRTISKALNQTPLSLLRGQHTLSKVSTLEKRFTFKHFKFIRRFHFKTMLREKGSLITLFFGVLLSSVVLFLGFFLNDSCTSFIKTMEKDVPYQYMYSFESPHLLNKYSSQGEAIQLKELTYEYLEDDMQLTLNGINKDTQFFTRLELNTLAENEVYIAPCIKYKFNLQVGDWIIVKDKLKDKSYSLLIKGIAPYDYGQYLFTSTENFNQILGLRKLEYSALMTDHSLGLSDNIQFTEMRKEEMLHAIDPFLEIMSSLTALIIVISICILVTVLYILLKMIIDKSQINISMVKIFGYSKKEIDRLYLSGYFFFVLLAFIIAIPLGYLVCKGFFDGVFINMQFYFLPTIFPSSLISGLLITCLGYASSLYLLKRSINRVSLTEALKNRE